MKSFFRNPAILTMALAVMGTTAAYATTTTIAVSAVPTGVSGQIATGYAPLTGSGWTNASGSVAGAAYNFIYANQTVATQTTTGGANGGDGYVSMDGLTTGDGSATAPFFAMDGDFDTGALSTTLTGLGIGDTITVKFDWAATQQLHSNSEPGCSFCTGASTDQLKVSLGTQNATTSILSIGDQGFSGWQDGVTLSFTATATSETLSFLDMGTPLSPQVPTFALLDNISATDTSAAPEPSSLMLLGTGLAGLSGLVRSRFKKSAKA